MANLNSNEIMQRAKREVFRLNAAGREKEPIVFTRSEFWKILKDGPVPTYGKPIEEQTFCGHPIKIIEDIDQNIAAYP